MQCNCLKYNYLIFRTPLYTMERSVQRSIFSLHFTFLFQWSCKVTKNIYIIRHFSLKTEYFSFTFLKWVNNQMRRIQIKAEH
jgi:hypothetical protein